MTKDIEKLVLTGKVSEYDMIDIALKNGMITMAQDGILKALDGLTSIEEVLRVAEFVSVQEDTPEETV
jgi:type II secretory ATPase GspE/PulE/Tfp pilus assembly ATPase PilB-like protein